MRVRRESRWPRLGLLPKYFLRGSGLAYLTPRQPRTAGRGSHDGGLCSHVSPTRSPCVKKPDFVWRLQGKSNVDLGLQAGAHELLSAFGIWKVARPQVGQYLASISPHRWGNRGSGVQTGPEGGGSEKWL